MTEDEMFGWHHWHDGHEFEQAPEDGKGQGSLVCCSPWICKELDTTEHLNNNNVNFGETHLQFYSITYTTAGYKSNSESSYSISVIILRFFQLVSRVLATESKDPC